MRANNVCYVIEWCASQGIHCVPCVEIGVPHRVLRKVQYQTQGNANVKSLFHGADTESLKFIVKEGLDFRVSNPSGALGSGAYFAESSRYSGMCRKQTPLGVVYVQGNTVLCCCFSTEGVQ